MSIIANLDILLGARTAGLDGGLDRAQKKVNQFKSQLVAKLPGGNVFAGMASTLASFGPIGLAAAGGVAAIGTAATAAAVTIRGVRQELTAIDEIAKSAGKAGVSFDQLASFRLAAGEAGLGPEQADKAIVKLQISLAEAQRNGGVLADQLKRVGLDAGRLLQAGPISAMEQLSAAVVGMKSPTDQLVLAYKLFGERGVSVLNILKGGPGQLAATAQAAKELGLTLSQAQTKQVEAANDAWGRMGLVATGVFRQIAAESAPVLQVIGQEVESIGRGISGWEQNIAPFVDSVAYVAGVTRDLKQAVDGILAITSFAQTGFRGDALGKLSDAVDFSSGYDAVYKLEEARTAAAAAAGPGNRPEISPDLTANEARMEADKAMAESAKRSAEERARAAQQSRDSIRERLRTMREEIATLRMGADAVERMRLARQGATAAQLRGFDAMTREKNQLEQISEAMQRGKQLRDQFASPQQQLRQEIQELHQLLNVGAIDFATFARASRDAASRLGQKDEKRSADTPSFGALQKGSVEAFSAALRNDKAGRTEALQKEGNKLLGNINQHIAVVAQRIGVQSMGGV